MPAVTPQLSSLFSRSTHECGLRFSCQRGNSCDFSAFARALIRRRTGSDEENKAATPPTKPLPSVKIDTTTRKKKKKRKQRATDPIYIACQHMHGARGGRARTYHLYYVYQSYVIRQCAENECAEGRRGVRVSKSKPTSSRTHNIHSTRVFEQADAKINAKANEQIRATLNGDTIAVSASEYILHYSQNHHE